MYIYIYYSFIHSFIYLFICLFIYLFISSSGRWIFRSRNERLFKTSSFHHSANQMFQCWSHMILGCHFWVFLFCVSPMILQELICIATTVLWGNKNWHLRLRASFCLSDIRSVLDVTQAHRTLLVPPTPHVRTWDIAKNVKNASAVSLRWHIYVIIYLYIISIIYMYIYVYIDHIWFDRKEHHQRKTDCDGSLRFFWPWCQLIIAVMFPN